MGQTVSSRDEIEDLSFEKGRRKFLIDDELRRGRSNNNISCTIRSTNTHSSTNFCFYETFNCRHMY